MSNPVAILTDNGAVMFECPGCGLLHCANVTGDTNPKWSWNGSLTAPTLSPSLLVRWNMTGTNRLDKVCHSFVRDGKIQFLNDCTHSLAGQTVPLKPWEET